MKIQIWGCRGSIPRPNPEMARYGGNTPCIEVVASSAKCNAYEGKGNCVGVGENNVNSHVNDGHRVILDLGSGAFDLGHKILGEMFQQKKKMNEQVESNNEDSSGGTPTPQPQPKFGGSILITHTHWDHIQGMCNANAHYYLHLSLDILPFH